MNLEPKILRAIETKPRTYRELAAFAYGTQRPTAAQESAVRRATARLLHRDPPPVIVLRHGWNPRQRPNGTPFPARTVVAPRLDDAALAKAAVDHFDDVGPADYADVLARVASGAIDRARLERELCQVAPPAEVRKLAAAILGNPARGHVEKIAATLAKAPRH